MSFQGLSIAIETVGIVEKLVEIWLNEVCNTGSENKMHLHDWLS